MVSTGINWAKFALQSDSSIEQISAPDFLVQAGIVSAEVVETPRGYKLHFKNAAGKIWSIGFGPSLKHLAENPDSASTILGVAGVMIFAGEKEGRPWLRFGMPGAGVKTVKVIDLAKFAVGA